MNFRHINILALSCITAAMSCVQVKTYDPDSVTGTAQVSFSAEWPDASGYYPETLDIAVARTVNSVHYVYEWPSETEGTVRAGDYHVTAFVADKDIYSLKGALDHFMSDPSYSMKNVSVTLRQTDAPAIGGETEEETDPSMGYVLGADHFYSDSRSFSAQPGQSVSVVLRPSDRTMELVFTFSLDVEEGVRIENLLADISGVPATVYPMTGIVDHQDLYRVSLTDIKANEMSGKRVTYEGRVRVLGLFAQDDASALSGPGVFHLRIRSVSDSGEKIQDEYANLRYAIQSASLMQIAQNREGYCKAVDSAELKVSKVFKVTDEPADGQQ